MVKRVCVSAPLHNCTDPDVTLGNGMGCRLVVHYWEDSQSVHGLRYYGNITQTRNVSEYYMLVLALYLVYIVMAALYVIGGHYIFVVGFLLSSFFFFPRLISAVADWMSTILRHMVWPQCKCRMQV